MDLTSGVVSKNWIEDINIRHLEQADLVGMEWEGEFTHFRKMYAEAYARIVHGLSVGWVAEMHPVGLVGQVLVQLACDRPELADGLVRAYVYAFRVRPQYRGCGLGARLMRVVEEDLRQRGFSVVTLNVAKDNPRARQLYDRLGYHPVADDPGIWSYEDHLGVWHQVIEPAWRMEKELA